MIRVKLSGDIVFLDKDDYIRYIEVITTIADYIARDHLLTSEVIEDKESK